MTTNETLNNANKTIASIPSGTLIQFSQHAHYAKDKNTKDYAITTSKTTPTNNLKHYNISDAFTNIHQCNIIWNNKQHFALIYYERNYPKRFYLKIRTGFINANPYFSNHLPILHTITP